MKLTIPFEHTQLDTVNSGSVGPVPGTVLGGRYRLDHPIGGGSFGTVFKARQLELERDVAVKILATSAGTDPEALARFRREGQSACRVQHPNAVTVFEFAVNHGGVAYLGMELLEGQSLEKELEERGPLPSLRAAARKLGVLPGLTRNAAPRRAARAICAGLVIVPMPSAISGTSARIACAASHAPGVRSVISIAPMPPACKARASGTAWR